jgi:hypothetical protein
MLAAATAKLADLQARAGRLAEAAEEVRRTREALERESDPAAEQRDRAELERSRALREAALLHDRSLEAARAALDLARRHHLEATAEQSARARLGQELAAAARACDSAEQLRAQARGDENLASAAQQQARARTEAAQARAAIARAGAQRARQIVEIVREQANLQEHQAALAAAQQEQHNTLRLAAQLGALRITRQGMDIIRSAGQDLEQAQALLAAQATRIDISLLPGTAGQVSVGDVAVGAGETSRAVVDPTDIVIENLGTLRIPPFRTAPRSSGGWIARARNVPPRCWKRSAPIPQRRRHVWRNARHWNGLWKTAAPRCSARRQATRKRGWRRACRRCGNTPLYCTSACRRNARLWGWPRCRRPPPHWRSARPPMRTIMPPATR